MRFTMRSFFEYISDILHWRKDPIAYKTSEFFIRNLNRVRSVYSIVKYAIVHTIDGIRNLKNDVIEVTGLSRKRYTKKYNKASYRE